MSEFVLYAAYNICLITKGLNSLFVCDINKTVLYCLNSLIKCRKVSFSRPQNHTYNQYPIWIFLTQGLLGKFYKISYLSLLLLQFLSQMLSPQ